MDKVYDLIILGAGPAGITAAVYAVRKRLDFLVITLDIGGQTTLSGDIENYTGYQFITGPELTLKFQEHMESFGTKVNIPEKVVEIKKENDLITVVTDRGKYRAKTAIIATGKSPRKLKVEGEEEFRNKGVTYCATCDGPLFQNKKVAIIGGGNSGLQAALQMLKISPKVYIIDIAPQLAGDPIMVEKISKSAKVEVLSKAVISRIYGDSFVKGIFVEIGLIPNSSFAKVLAKNDKGEIIVDCYNRTNLEAVFAAGDVTNVPEKQIIIACGEGSKACLCAFKYLSTHTF